MLTNQVYLQLKRYLRVAAIALGVTSLVGISFMYGTRDIRAARAQTSPPVTPNTTGCVGGVFTPPTGSDSSYSLAAIRDLASSRSQDECNIQNVSTFSDQQIGIIQSEMAQIQTNQNAIAAALKITLPPINGTTPPPPPPPTCNPPSTLVNGVCTPPSPPPQGKPVLNPAGTGIADFNVMVGTGGANQFLCQGGGAGVIPAGVMGQIVAGPKTFMVNNIGTVCVNVDWTGNPGSGWTPVASLLGQ